jgi:hypothetical protein
MIVGTNTNNSLITWNQLAHNEESTPVGTKPVSFLTNARFLKIIMAKISNPKIPL